MPVSVCRNGLKLRDLKAQNIIASAGVLALGMSGVRGANLTGLGTQEQAKRWTVEGQLGFFYDDNSLNSAVSPVATWGFEIAPRLALNLPLERTVIKSSYDLRLDYYDKRVNHHVDYEQQFDVRANHKFSERSTLDFDETLISASQPEVTGTGAQTTFIKGDRTDYSHWRNYLKMYYDLRLSGTIGASVGFRNYLYDYKQDGIGGLSSLLDRDENEAFIEAQAFPAEHTKVFIGYMYAFTHYSSQDPLVSYVPATSVVTNGGVITTNVVLFQQTASPSVRDSHSHYVYVGGQRIFSPRLTGSASLGARYTDYYNQGISELSPYVDISGTANYLPGSTLQIGTKVDRNATDSGLGTNGVITLDQLSTSVYLGVRHRLTPRFFVTGNIRYQHSVYNGGDFDGQADDYVAFSPGVEYMISQNFWATANYTREDLLSDRPDRTFGKNRVFFGIRAAY